MNKVQLIIAELSDDQLRKGVQELHELDTSGILCSDGEVRKLAHKLAAETGMASHDARTVAPSAILRAAALKWAGIK